MDFSKMSVAEYVEGIKNRKFTATEAVKTFAERAAKDDLGAVLEVFGDWKAAAKAVDDKVKAGKAVGALAGVPVFIKDNILYKGHRATAASKILEGFVSPYNATVVQKLIDADAVILGRANCDEFAFGTTGENSAFGATKNPLNKAYVAGGSSSGSAAAVAAGYCLAALGTDTGGSVRCPAAFCGLVSTKPTYGSVSRFGLIAYGSGIEQCGWFTKNVGDNRLLHSVLAGADENDATSRACPKNLERKAAFDVKKLKIARVKEVWEAAKDIEMFKRYNEIFDWFKAQGALVFDISLKNISKCLPCYYVIAMAQASSNLSRFDGVRYGASEQAAENISELYRQTRGKHFGREVKRRIMLGNLVLESENNSTYAKAQRIAADIKRDLQTAFSTVDCVLMPTTFGSALKLGEKVTDPVKLYLEDLFTVPMSLTGVPTISVPCGTTSNGMPVGLQIFCDKFNEGLLYNVAEFFEKGGK